MSAQTIDKQATRLQVALVASDTAIRSSVRLLLTVSGMTVHEFRSAREFLSDRSGSYACVVADWQLSDMSGNRFYGELRRQNPELPVVALAAAPEALDLPGPVRTGVRVVAKPFVGDLLIETIEASTRYGPEAGNEVRSPPRLVPAAS